MLSFSFFVEKCCDANFFGNICGKLFREIYSLRYIDRMNEIVPNSPYRFLCEPCGIKTNNKKDYNKHCLTAKHINRTSVEQNPPKVGFSCKRCNKIYNARNSLWYHEQKCDDEKKQKLYINQENAQVSQLSNMVFELIKSNSDLQKQMMEVCKNINKEI